MRLVFTEHRWVDYQHWLTVDWSMVKRINRLTHDTARSPFDGIGKPEPLRHNLAGTWSRRMTDEHRFVCLVESDDLVVLQLRYRHAR